MAEQNERQDRHADPTAVRESRAMAQWMRLVEGFKQRNGIDLEDPALKATAEQVKDEGFRETAAARAAEIRAAKCVDQDQARQEIERRWLEVCPHHFWQVRLHTIPDEEVRVRAERYVRALVQRDVRANLLITGSMGAGKSTTALAIGRTLHEWGWTMLYVPLGRLLNGIGGRGWLDEYVAPDLLILEVDEGRDLLDWHRPLLFDLINERWNEDRPTIITTNLPPEAARNDAGGFVAGAVGLDRVLSPATYDRFQQGAASIRVVRSSLRLETPRLRLDVDIDAVADMRSEAGG